MAPPARLELTTLRLGGARSIQVSYGGLLLLILPKKPIAVKAAVKIRFLHLLKAFAAVFYHICDAVFHPI